MPNPIIFFAWQWDRPKSHHFDFIRGATEQAIQRLGKLLTIENSPRLDHDTQGESGIPAIGETIFRKIRRSAMLLADVTFVGKAEARPGESPKRLPNPNVLIELGYAAATIGWDRIIPVMNTHFGHQPRLPFDLRFRRFPIGYELRPSAVPDRGTHDELAANIEQAIQQCLAKDYDRVEEVFARISTYARSLISQHAAHPTFFETKKDNTITMRLDLAIAQLLELSVIRSVPENNETGFAYAWTYLGRECCRRLGYAVPELPADSEPPYAYLLGSDSYPETVATCEIQMTFE